MNVRTERPARETAEALDWLRALAERFPLLLAELAPAPASGTPRPGASGGSRDGGRAPLRLYVSDTLRDVTDGVVELEEAVHERLALRPTRPSPAPVPVRLRRLAELLDQVAAVPDLYAHVTSEARRMAGRCARATGDPEQLVRIPGRCPACDSVSLRALPERAVVMCVNPACRHVLEEESDG
ncbi:hypothetical protein ACOKM5_21670 [Streptomyces sp. BH097]|uniref:hypothetical protein n=1 Tax=unclassified Streptomyces TaxID=2593676 RepID=UPI003BB530C0